MGNFEEYSAICPNDLCLFFSYLETLSSSDKNEQQKSITLLNGNLQFFLPNGPLNVATTEHSAIVEWIFCVCAKTNPVRRESWADNAFQLGHLLSDHSSRNRWPGVCSTCSSIACSCLRRNFGLRMKLKWKKIPFIQETVERGHLSPPPPPGLFPF